MKEKQQDILFANDNEQRQYIIAAVKRIVYRNDENTDIILFGNQARCNWHEESE